MVVASAALVTACSSDPPSSTSSGTSPSEATATVSNPASTGTASNSPTISSDVSTSAPQPAATADPTPCTVSTESTGLQHTVLGHVYNAEIHRPSNGPDNLRLPVVIDLHGLYSDGPTQAALSRFGELADRTASEGHGFIVVEPTGQPGPIDGAVGWEVAASDEPDRDDADYLTQLIDTLVAEHCADPLRTFLAGYSNGGIFASEYACTHPDRIAAIATVAGFDHQPGCNSIVPVIAFHGTEDPIVPWAAGGTSLLLDDDSPPALADALGRGVEPQFVESASAAGCDPIPERTTFAVDVTLISWTGCTDGSAHELYEVVGGGHTWPGAADQPDADLIGPTTLSIDATKTIWQFFREHPRQV